MKPAPLPTERALATVSVMQPLPAAVVDGQGPPVGVVTAGAAVFAAADAAGATAGLGAAAAAASGPPTWATPAMASAVSPAMIGTQRLRSLGMSTATPT
jgi:hypothetical protein